ncbi:Pupal cuticle protein [Amphibalanus amphitrite]|uniref:Pupal cuticle protein n=1 Tax=Amphibalanus amphitrite TaxID=1232801 RepID=A0A6A4V124_AMPAM|nr:Pupal cuticle protein [Amphibalanus amphitrite]
MKTFVAVCLLACAAAFPQELASIEGSGEPPVEIAARSSSNIDSSIFSDDILRSEFEMADDGQFQYGFETRDGIVVDAAGENRQIGEGVGAVMRGSYSYTSPEGIDVTINWEADENGFRASGDQVPAVPEYVTRLLKTLPAEPQAAGAVRAAEQAVAAVEEEAAAAADAAAVSVPVVSAPAVVVADPAESVVPDESAFIVLEAGSETAEQEELLS